MLLRIILRMSPKIPTLNKEKKGETIWKENEWKMVLTMYTWLMDRYTCLLICSNIYCFLELIQSFKHVITFENCGLYIIVSTVTMTESFRCWPCRCPKDNLFVVLLTFKKITKMWFLNLRKDFLQTLQRL